MTFTIDPDADRDELAARAAASVDRRTLRASDARQNRLQRNVRRQARTWDARLTLDPGHPTARVRNEPDEAPEVVISAGCQHNDDDPYPWESQTVTDLPPRAWDWLVQRAFGVHEVGHIRYTDFESADDYLDNFSSADRGFAHSVHNALEDGAIEQQVAGRWPNYYTPLRVMRANLFVDATPGIFDPEVSMNHDADTYVYPMAHAIQMACLHGWMLEVYDLDTGILDALVDPDDPTHHFATDDDRALFVDEALSATDRVIDRVLSTPDPQARNHIVFSFAEEMLDLLDRADADGKAQQSGQAGEGDDGVGMPDDSRDNHSGAADAAADELGDIDPDDITAGDGVADADAPADVEVDAEVVAAAEENATDDARETAGVTSNLLDELEELQDAVGAAGEELDDPTLQYPTDDWEPQNTAQRARTASKRLEQLLRQRLQSERRTDTSRHQPRGRYTGRGGATVRATRGESEVKERRSQPDEKDYNAVIVLDRSGSMSGQSVAAGETAAGMLTLALEAVGVDVMAIELYDTTARVASPFGVASDARPGRLFHSQTSGGTPLTETLELARARLNREGGNRFMFVVTDGRPTNRSAFESALAATTFPVVGVTINSSAGQAGEGVYHRNVTAAPDADIQQSLTNLIQEVMF